MGSEFNLNWFDDDTYAEIYKQEFSIGTAENACKWGTTHQAQDTYFLDPCVNHLRRAKANGQKFRGHNLCWGEWNPSWLVNFKGTPAELDKILKDHITYVMQTVPYWAGDADQKTIIGWDVVNEAIVDEEGTFKSNIWYDNLPDYVERAFRYAEQADPTTLLFYNDYNVLDIKKQDKIVSMI